MCPLSLCYLTTARPYDFLTEVAYGSFEPGKNEACVELEIVDSVELELTESLLVEIELLHPTSTITMSPTMSFGYIQIVDDDSMFRIYCMSTSSSNDFWSVAAVIGLERTAYYLSSGSEEVQVCVFISTPTPSQTRCPITFPFDIIFRLSTEAAGSYSMNF